MVRTVVLIWTAAFAILTAAMQRLPALAIFLFAIAVPVALLLHVAIPANDWPSNSLRELFGSVMFTTLLRCDGPTLFPLRRIMNCSQSAKLNGWLKIETTIFGPAKLGYGKCPFSVYGICRAKIIMANG